MVRTFGAYILRPAGGFDGLFPNLLNNHPHKNFGKIQISSLSGSL